MSSPSQAADGRRRLGAAVLLTFGFLAARRARERWRSWEADGLVFLPGDGDSWMRLVRVRKLLEDGAWWSPSIPGSHLGQEESLVWTRLLDLLICALAVPLRAWMPDERAILLAGSLVGPLLLLAFIPLILRALGALGLGALAASAALLPLLVHPLLTPEFRFGRADHHGLLLLLAVALTAALFRALRRERPARAMLGAGLVGGLGLWVNPEFALFPAVFCVVLATRWVRGEEQSIRELRAFLAGLASACTAAVVLEHPPAEVLVVEHDRVSIVHVTLFATGAVLAFGLERLRLSSTLQRGGLAAATAVGGLALNQLLFPGFYLGPAAAMDPALAELWLLRLNQTKPLLSFESSSDLRYAFLTAGLVLPGLLALAASHRTGEECRSHRVSWEYLALGLVCTTLLTLRFRRLALFVPLFALLPVALAFGAARPLARGDMRGLLRRQLAIMGLTGLPFLLWFISELTWQQVVEPGPPPVDPACEAQLDQWIQTDKVAELAGSSRALVMTRIGEAPQLLWWTDHRIMAWSHHRSTDGLLRVLGALRAGSEDELRSLIVGTPTPDLLLLCPSSGDTEPYFRRHDPLTPPDWLERLPTEEGEPSAWRVVGQRPL